MGRARGEKYLRRVSPAKWSQQTKSEETKTERPWQQRFQCYGEDQTRCRKRINEKRERRQLFSEVCEKEKRRGTWD